MLGTLITELNSETPAPHTRWGLRRGRQTSLYRRPDMHIVDELDTARAVLTTFALAYHIQPDGQLADRNGRVAHPRVIEIVTEAMAALS